MGTLLNSIHIEFIVPGTATVLTTDELPGTVIVSLQAQAAVGSSPDTLCFISVRQTRGNSHGALTACLRCTTRIMPKQFGMALTKMGELDPEAGDSSLSQCSP